MTAYDPQFECCAAIIDGLAKIHGDTVALVMLDACVARAMSTGQRLALEQLLTLARNFVIDDARLNVAKLICAPDTRRVA